MKKLFLSSSFKDVSGLFPSFIGEEISGKKATFIPTAAKHEKVNFYVKSGKTALEKLGIVVEEVDVSSDDVLEIKRAIETNDFIYISGGNTFFLLQELKKTGTDKIIFEQINAGKPYIGESAGSIVVSPDIEYVKDMDNCMEALELTSYDSLHAIEFYPLPHYTNFPFKKIVEKIIKQYTSELALVPISNSQVILVNGDEVEVRNR